MNEELRHAAEAVKDPTSYGLATYAWVVVLSAWGGAVRFIQKVKAGEMTRTKALKSLVGEVVMSAFAGVLTFYLAEAAGSSPLLTAVLVGIAGHMGARSLELLEKIYERWLGSKGG